MSTPKAARRDDPAGKDKDKAAVHSLTPPPSELGAYEVVVPIVLTALCAATRYYRLDEPKGGSRCRRRPGGGRAWR